MTALAATLLLLLATGAPSRPGEALEYEVKAAFLFNFMKFVEWPREGLPLPDSPVTLCIVGVDPFGTVLDETVRGERIDEHPLAVLRFDGPPPAGACHLAFVGAAEQGRYAELLGAIDPARVLTVGDAIEFLDAGGYLAFYLDNGRVRFAVNANAVRTSRLRVSSKLLRVAAVHTPPREGGF